MKFSILLALATLFVGSYGNKDDIDLEASLTVKQRDDVFYLEEPSGNGFVCYYGSWAVYRHGPAKFGVENIDPKLCTHLMYGFVGLNYDGTVRLLDPYNDIGDDWKEGAFTKLQKLRRLNPKLKIQCAIGGWNEGSVQYSRVVNDPALRRVFVNSILEFTVKHNFDGFDLDWEYPGERGGSPSDREAFSLLIKELSAAFKPRKLVLSAAVSANTLMCPTSYNCKDLAQYLDFINIMSYDLHGSWEKRVGHHTALYAHPNDLPSEQHLNVDNAIKYWVKCTGQPEKLNIGLAAYGRTFLLANPSDHKVGAPSTGAAPPGIYVPESGFLGFNEICMEQRKGLWKVYDIPEQKVVYAVKNNVWVGYDSVETILRKVEYAKSMKLGGASIWSIETDDFRGDCGMGKNPLLEAINRALNLKDTSNPGLDEKPEPPPVVPAPDSDYSHMCKTCGQVFVHPKNPQAFITCMFSGADGSLKAVSRTCPDGLVFDEQLLVCNFPK